MGYIRKFFGHLNTVLTHKRWVLYYAHGLGITWQGITHDFSKFSPVEFFESVKFYQGGKKSPIPVVKKELGYSKAWQHHKGRNPHHYEYWTDNYDSGITAVKIPYKYVLEMICDWCAACRTYSGNGDDIFRREYEWWNGRIDRVNIHQETKSLITNLLKTLSDLEGTTERRDESAMRIFRKNIKSVLSKKYETGKIRN